MSEYTTEQNVIRIAALVFGKAIDNPATFSKDRETAWDSLKHIEFIMTLEQELRVSFAPEEIPKLTTLPLIITRVEELHAGQA